MGFYTERYREDDRLRATPHGRLELLRTRELLARHLPSPPGPVADIGGGTGVHAEWLAQRGSGVHLIDIVPEHVHEAAALPGVVAAVGDARDVPLSDGSADAVLLLRPLYHLLRGAERVLCMRDARRIGRDGAPVFAAAISRHATLMDFAGHGRLNEQSEPLVRAIIESGQHDPVSASRRRTSIRRRSCRRRCGGPASTTSPSVASKGRPRRCSTRTVSSRSTR